VADARLRRAIPRILLASAAMGGALWFAQDVLSGIADADAARAAVVLAVLVALGLVVFAAAAVGFGAARLADIKRLLDRSSG
jgi:putative peptidoglycan lipid II flippase